MHTLYVVATPIGNLEDVTLRALRVLSEVGLIAAEDTRVTRKLLSRHGIRTPTTSFHEHNAAARVPKLLTALETQDVALVSDAGMPGVSDPGAELVEAAARSGANVVVVPGPSAVTAAVAISGLPVHGFVCVGFLPRASRDRRKALESLAHEPRALVAFEAPHRMLAVLADLRQVLGDRRIAVCREMTKLYEEVFRGTASEALEHFQSPRGEFTIVIEGASGQAPTAMTEEEVSAMLHRLQAEGRGARESVDLVVEASGLPKRRVYRAWLQAGRPTGHS